MITSLSSINSIRTKPNMTSGRKYLKKIIKWSSNSKKKIMGTGCQALINILIGQSKKWKRKKDSTISLGKLRIMLFNLSALDQVSPFLKPMISGTIKHQWKINIHVDHVGLFQALLFMNLWSISSQTKQKISHSNMCFNVQDQEAALGVYQGMP